MVEDGRPSYAGVPDAAIDCAEVKRVGIEGDSGGGEGTASAEGTDEALLEAAEKIGETDCARSGVRAKQRKIRRSDVSLRTSCGLMWEREQKKRARRRAARERSNKGGTQGR